MNTNERERLDEMRERNEERKQAFAVWKERGIVIESLPVPDAITDIDFLLSLLDSQAEVSNGLESIAKSFIQRYYNEGAWKDKADAWLFSQIVTTLNATATRMRDKCVAKARQMGLRCGLCPHSNPPNADGSCSAYGYNGVDCQAQPCACRHHSPTVQYYGKLITALESLTLDQVEQKQ